MNNKSQRYLKYFLLGVIVTVAASLVYDFNKRVPPAGKDIKYFASHLKVDTVRACDDIETQMFIQYNENYLKSISELSDEDIEEYRNAFDTYFTEFENITFYDVMAIIHYECRFIKDAVNKSTGATGIIQFMPFVARSLGTSTVAISHMTITQQMELTSRFLKQNLYFGYQPSDLTDVADLYLVVIAPAKVTQEVLYRTPSKAYSLNRPWDFNDDGVITKTDIKNIFYGGFSPFLLK